jgi:hypothetical protein
MVSAGSKGFKPRRGVSVTCTTLRRQSIIAFLYSIVFLSDHSARLLVAWVSCVHVV